MTNLYIPLVGKRPPHGYSFKDKSPEELFTYEEAQKLNGFARILADDEVLFDFDDANQAEIMMNIVEAFQLNCRVYCTTRGKHFLFKNSGIDRNKTNVQLAVGLRADIKLGSRCSYQVLKIDGEERFIEWDIEDGQEYQKNPKWLFPIKGGNIDFFSLGDGDGRNDALFNHIIPLIANDFTVDESRECITIINKFVLKEPLSDIELETILRDEAFQNIIADSKKKDITIETFKRFLIELGISIKYNELLNIVQYENLPHEYAEITDIQNVMPIKLQYDFMKHIGKKNINKHQVTDLIVLVADENSYNPVRNYLLGTSWDGKDRFPEIFEILGVQSEFNQSLIKKWFYQTAAMPFNTLDNPIQPEGVLILQGAEGIGKTRFFKLICPDFLWFSSLDKELTTKNKDILIQMLSAWIGEIGEIDRTFKANKSDIKNFMTLDKDTIRKPYAREPVTKARTTSFCGTTNKDEFLNDDTGFRRWWVVKISQSKIDMGNFVDPDNVKQFWGQCYVEICKNSLCYLLTEDERNQLEEANKEVIEMLPAEEELRLRLDFDAPIEKWHWVQPSVIKPLPEYCVDRYTPKEIGTALTAIMRDVPEIIATRGKKGKKYFIPPTIINTDWYRNTK